LLLQFPQSCFDFRVLVALLKSPEFFLHRLGAHFRQGLSFRLFFKQAAVLRSEGPRDARIAQAEADQTERERSDLGDGAKLQAIGEGEGEAIRAKGLAEGDAIKARMLVEAEGIQRKAESWKEYGDAAVIQFLLERYPDIVAAMGEPMQAIGTGLAGVDRISIVDIGGGGSEGQPPVGRLINQIPEQFLQLNEQLKAVFGIGLAELLSRRIEGSGSSAGATLTTAPETAQSGTEELPPE